MGYLKSNSQMAIDHFVSNSARFSCQLHTQHTAKTACRSGYAWRHARKADRMPQHASFLRCLGKTIAQLRSSTRSVVVNSSAAQTDSEVSSLGISLDASAQICMRQMLMQKVHCLESELCQRQVALQAAELSLLQVNRDCADLQDVIATSANRIQELERQNRALDGKLRMSRQQLSATGDEVDHLRSSFTLSASLLQAEITKMKTSLCDAALESHTAKQNFDKQKNLLQQQIVRGHMDHEREKSQLQDMNLALQNQLSSMIETQQKLDELCEIQRQNLVLHEEIDDLTGTDGAVFADKATITDFGDASLKASSAALLAWLEPAPLHRTLAVNTDIVPVLKGSTKFTQTRKWKPHLPAGFQHGAVEKVVQVSVTMVSRATSTATMPAALHTQILAAIKLQQMWKRRKALMFSSGLQMRKCTCCGNDEDDVGPLQHIPSPRPGYESYIFCENCIEDQISIS